MITVDDKKIEWFREMTVADVIDSVEHTQFCAAVRLNNRLVSSPLFHETEVADNSVIQILPLIAGG